MQILRVFKQKFVGKQVFSVSREVVFEESEPFVDAFKLRGAVKVGSEIVDDSIFQKADDLLFAHIFETETPDHRFVEG